MRRTLLLFVVLGALTLSASLPAYSQDEYDAAAGCDWYWGYRWYTAGAWEWWCWDPVMGWWYGTDESGTKQFARTNQPGSFLNAL
jgi:hypothetical protein